MKKNKAVDEVTVETAELLGLLPDEFEKKRRNDSPSRQSKREDQ